MSNSEPLLAENCATCRGSKAVLSCGLCQNALCKKCAEVLPRDYFSFLKNVPETLQHVAYCGSCFDAHVASAKTQYEDLLKKAKTVTIFYRKERNVPVKRKSKVQLTVSDCADRDEALLRLAFFSAQQSCNAVADVEVTPQKIKINGYQTTLWHAKGFPGMVVEFQ